MILRRDDERKISSMNNTEPQCKEKRKTRRLGSTVLRQEACETAESTEEWRTELQSTKKSTHDYNEVPGKEIMEEQQQAKIRRGDVNNVWVRRMAS